ncbi:MAG: large conductance mechanosensitive channel protein MscL [Mobilitalea sp.]
MLKEFKKFILRGNMIDLAVGIIIGTAFTALVNSLVNDVIMPVLSLFTNKIDFTNLFISLDGIHYDTLQEAVDAEAAVVKYGAFISGIISFVIMALVVFLIVKGINKMRKPEVAEVTTKKCPHCLSDVNLAATKCPFCTSDLTE